MVAAGGRPLAEGEHLSENIVFPQRPDHQQPVGERPVGGIGIEVRAVLHRVDVLQGPPDPRDLVIDVQPPPRQVMIAADLIIPSLGRSLDLPMKRSLRDRPLPVWLGRMMAKSLFLWGKVWLRG